MLLWLLAAFWSTAAAPTQLPHVVVITVDTLRYDRLSINGYHRPTSPNIDRLLNQSVRFDEARVVEPLTGPSMCSMWTSLHPHDHGATRNALSMRPDLPTLPGVLERRGYQTVAFVGNWTLRHELTGLGDYFATYREMLTRRRYFGLIRGEATADDLTATALDWIDDHQQDASRWRFALWVHYVEPHAPYRLHKEFLKPLGLKDNNSLSAKDRYDTEIAFVDHAVGNLVKGLRERFAPENVLILFTADHGESLGEHAYWGHGRHLYDVTLKVPLGISWKGHLEPRSITGLASNLDIAPTLLGLLDLPQPTTFEGFDWSPILRGEAEPAPGRVTQHQSHRGAVVSWMQEPRREGLLEVGLVGDGHKEVYRTKAKKRLAFDLVADRREMKSLVAADTDPSGDILAWLEQIKEGLEASGDLPPPSLDAEAIEKLRALGYLD